MKGTGYAARMPRSEGIALVLGGGGLVGGAWELGVIDSLTERGLGTADLVLGTSIGSIVGAAVCSGTSADTVLRAAAATEAELRTYLEQSDPALIGRIMGRGYGLERSERAAIGALAALAATGREPHFVDLVGTLLPGADWPPHLAISAVDIEDGSFVVWNEQSGVPLSLAVAASCAGPGIFPPVEVDGHRYTDGGIRSPTNADRAAGHALVVIIAGIDDPDFSELVAEESKGLSAAGAHVVAILPDVESSVAIGPNGLDVARLDAAFAAGRRQAQSAAELVLD